MSRRPAIPLKVQREVLFEARHRCAVCCEPTPLERAHIQPWSRSKDHSVANLIALCANCHSRADHESWGETYLRRYKVLPCALERERPPVTSAEQQALIDLIVATDPDSMTEMQRQRLVSMVAAYAGVQIRQVEVISFSKANSTRIRFRMPESAARKLATGFADRDPLLSAFLGRV